jgi:putative DNA primase/helicase
MALNFDDVRRQLIDAGLELDREIIADGRIQRWREANGDRERRGWSRLHQWTSTRGNTYIGGSFGIWQGMEPNSIKIEMPDKSSGIVVPQEDRAAMAEAAEAAKNALNAARAHEAKKAAEWAWTVWAMGEPCIDHEYLTRKGIKSHGARILKRLDGLQLDGLDESNRWKLGEALGGLMVGMHDEHGQVVGIQFIYGSAHPRYKKAQKEFWPSGMAMGGSFGVIGGLPRSGTLLLAEGFATAASAHEATGLPTAYAFSANNLLKAAKGIRKSAKQIKILVLADDDYLTKGNPGVTAASALTSELQNTAWLKPNFTDQSGTDLRAGAKLSDFNDLAHLTGSGLALAAQINTQLDELGWRAAYTPNAGGSALSGGAGEGTSKRPGARSSMPIDDLVARYIPIDDGTGKHVWDRWTRKIASKEQMNALLPAGLRNDDIKRHPVWQARGGYYIDEIGFDPTEKDPSVKLNTWRGWPREPKEGSCERIKELIWYLCGEEENRGEVCKWFECWMAYPLKKPGAKLSSAVIMHGPQGTGKTTLGKLLAWIYGDYSVTLNQRGIEDRFNSDWADSKLFILAEEVVTRQEMWSIKNELKDLVTGTILRINPKNLAAYTQKNQMQIMYLSNENQPLPIDNDDRRHLVIYNPPAESFKYYKELHDEIENGGAEAFYHYLLNLDLGDFRPNSRPPMTKAKKTLIDLSKGSELRFIDAWVEGDTSYPVCPCLSSDLYDAYRHWCQQQGERNPRPANHFTVAISRLTGWQKKKVRVYENFYFTGPAVPKNMMIPAMNILEEHNATQTPDQTQSQWLTSCWIKFNNAIKDKV